MTGRAAIDGLIPSELADAVVAESRTRFLALYGGSHLLLVRIEDDDTELVVGLKATAVQGGEGMLPQPVMGGPMEFHTGVMRVTRISAETHPRKRTTEPDSLASLLESANYFALPLRKRRDKDVLFMDRISVGRARNKDIVLRHPSVSKSHAWFEVDEAGDFRVSDAGSSNLTRLNGEKLPPREPQRVDPGDVVRFGSVECVLCSPQTLWSTIHAG